MTSLHNYVNGFLAAKRPMIQYMRDKDNRKIGVLVAFRHINNLVAVGWSKVNEAQGDKFNRDYGIARAIDKDRLMYLDEFEAYAEQSLPNLPARWREFEDKAGESCWVKVSQYDDFVYRCKRYFTEKTDRKNLRVSVSAE